MTDIDDQTRDAQLLALLRTDGHTILEALWRYVDRMQENVKTLTSEADGASRQATEGQPALLLGQNGYRLMAETMTNQGNNAQRIANRLSDLLAGVEPEPDDVD